MTLNVQSALWRRKDAIILEPTAQIGMKIDPYYQRQKCRPMNLVSENIRFMRIFAGVPLGGGVKRHWGLSTTAIFWRFRWLRLRKLQRYGKQYYITICYPRRPLTDCNEWPWVAIFYDKIRFRPAILESVLLNVRNSTTSAILRCSVHCTTS